MRIKKTSQYIEGGASLSNVYGTSNENGYTQQYINGIIESGSNANGSYVKYADGTMICYKTETVTGTMTTPWGSLYQKSTDDGVFALGNYAQEFIEVPNIQATVNNKNGGAGALVARIHQPTTTSFGGIVLLRPINSPYANPYKIDLIAIGRWK